MNPNRESVVVFTLLRDRLPCYRWLKCFNKTRLSASIEGLLSKEVLGTSSQDLRLSFERSDECLRKGRKLSGHGGGEGCCFDHIKS